MNRAAAFAKAAVILLAALALQGFAAMHSVGDMDTHRRDYAGKTMQIHGVLNKCSGDICSLCPDWKHIGTQGCLGIRGWRDDPDGNGMANLYRYAELEVTAEIFNNGFDGISDCFSARRLCYGPLLVLRVDRLIERRPAPIVHDADEPYIVPPDEQSEAALRAAFNAALVKMRRDPIDTRNDSERLFKPDSNAGYLCFRREVDDSADPAHLATLLWPVKGSDFLFSYANPYHCMLAMREKEGDPWVVSVTISAYGVEPVQDH